MTPDQQQFRANILAFPKQLTQAAIQTGNLEVLAKAATDKNPDSIYIIGMGGSGTPGSILQNIADYAIVDVPIFTWKDSGLPFSAQGGSAPGGKNPLLVFVSFSGNTRETLSALPLALQAGYMVAVVAGGGTLLAKAQENKLPFTTFRADSSLQPRQAYGYTLYATLTLLQSVFPRLTIPDLSALTLPMQFAQSAEATAARIAGKTTLVYTTLPLSHLGQLVKISITETGKALAFANTLPEINHNELNLIETRPQGLCALFITSADEYNTRKPEFELTSATLDAYNVPSETIVLPGASALETTANAIALAQWIGYYITTLNGRNPLGLEVVNKIKKLAQQKGL
jgi:glucose/mannose-6-phosphate isomerase